MVLKFINIIRGWWNYFFYDKNIEDIAIKRASHCSSCPHAKTGGIISAKDYRIPSISGKHCELCGCPLAAKLRSPEESCEMDEPKWGGVIIRKEQI